MSKDKGVMLIPRDSILPTARFLTQEEQEAYQDAVSQYDGRARQSLDVSRDGSNLFKVLKLNEIFPDGKRTATLSDLGQVVDTDKDYLRWIYVDAPAVVLRSAGDSYSANDFLAKDLAKQIRKKTFKNPVIVTGLEIEPDDNSPYGLKFKLTDKTEVIDAPELAYENNKRRFTKTDERGLPIFDGRGNRTLYTRKSGLSGLYLGRFSGLNSYDRSLVDSGSGGKVIVVDAGDVARENLEVLKKQIKEAVINYLS